VDLGTAQDDVSKQRLANACALISQDLLLLPAL